MWEETVASDFPDQEIATRECSKCQVPQAEKPSRGESEATTDPRKTQGDKTKAISLRFMAQNRVTGASPTAPAPTLMGRKAEVRPKTGVGVGREGPGPV